MTNLVDTILSFCHNEKLPCHAELVSASLKPQTKSETSSD